jgi:N-acetylmuramoyl-L-alanine amidase
MVRLCQFRFAAVLVMCAGLSLLFRNAAAEPAAAKLELHVVKGFQQEYSLSVPALRDNDLVMIDIGAFARALRFVHKRQAGHLTVERDQDGKRWFCHFRDRNNFVRFESPGENGSAERVIQMASPPRLIGESMYLPVTDAVRIFSLWIDRQITYDRRKASIEAFLWSAPPVSDDSRLGILSPEDRSIGAGIVKSFSGPTRLNALEVDELANGVIIRIRATGSPAVASFIKPDKSGMAYLTFQQAAVDLSEFSRTFTMGLIREIKALPLGNGAVQLSLAFNTGMFTIKSTRYDWDSRSNSYTISALTNVDVSEVYRQEKEKRIRQELLQDQQKWKFDTIVLDAGHGGKDPGAIGPAGTQEKTVVLNIVRELGGLIQKEWPDVKVVYTRSDDTFIPLKDRGKIANRHDGKLFVSVHCNAAKNRSAKGAEVYILGPHKNDDALEVAMMENAVIKQEADYEERYRGFSEEYTIISSLAQNAFTLQSTEAARYVLEGMQEKTKLNDRGVRQAGFVVLWTPSMPSILVEAGYLSNHEEERVLRQKSTQQAIAKGIFNGLDRYREQYERQQVAAASAMP